MIELFHLLAAAVYAIATLVGMRAVLRGSAASQSAWLLGAGALLHVGGFVALHGGEPPVPLESFPAALSLIGWLIAASYLMSLRFAHVRGVSAWVGGAATAFTGLAALGLFLAPPSPAPEGGAWSHAHVLLSTFGFSLLALTSLAGSAYLIKQSALKRKRASRFALPSLESLDRMEHWTLNLGYLLLTLGMLTGFGWGVRRGANPWTQHSVWLIAAWAVYLVPLSARIVSQKHGERPARMVVGGFAFLAFCYLGIRVLGIAP
jgi:ABC-type uncharacterized transport system permease subunit